MSNLVAAGPGDASAAPPAQPNARRGRIRGSRADQLYDVVNVIVLSAIALGVLYPLVYIVSSSFSNPAAVTSGRVWLWPVEPSIIAYERVYNYPTIWRGYANTIFYTVFGTAISVALTLLAAYPVSRRRFRGRNLYMFLFVNDFVYESAAKFVTGRLDINDDNDWNNFLAELDKIGLPQYLEIMNAAYEAYK